MKRIAALALCAACGSSGGGAWSEQGVPTPAFTTAYSLWVAGDNDVWIGGSSTWHYDGSAWTERTLPVASAVSDFYGFGSNDIYALGDSHVFHWDGTAWTDMAPPANGDFDSLWRVWGANDHDVWVANQINSGIYHYDGTAWTKGTLQFAQATAMWGSSATDVWIAGLGGLWHTSDGEQWMEDQGAFGITAYGMWGSGPSDIWTVGFDVAHYDGTTWTENHELNGDYNNIWGASADDVWAVGDRGSAMHWDGSSWDEGTALGSSRNFTRIHGSSSSNIWATAVDVGARQAFVYKLD